MIFFYISYKEIEGVRGTACPLFWQIRPAWDQGQNALCLGPEGEMPLNLEPNPSPVPEQGTQS